MLEKFFIRLGSGAWMAIQTIGIPTSGLAAEESFDGVHDPATEVVEAFAGQGLVHHRLELGGQLAFHESRDGFNGRPSRVFADAGLFLD